MSEHTGSRTATELAGNAPGTVGMLRKEVRVTALVVALAFLAAGVVGFIITGFDDFADHHTGEHLLWFEINPLHNVVHLVFGVAGLVWWRTARGVRHFGLLVAVGYLGALAYGPGLVMSVSSDRPPPKSPYSD